MVEFPEVPKAEMERCFPGGFTARDEAKALIEYAVIGLPGVDVPIDKLIADEKITKAEKDKVVNFAARKLEILLDLREKDPKRYRRAVIGIGWARLQRKGRKR